MPRPPRGAPRYQQIADDLARAILDGLLPSGSMLPPEPQLCERYGVSRITIRGALRLLEQDGLIERASGKGTFVRRPEPAATAEARLVGLVVPTTLGPFVSPIILGAQTALAERGYTLVVGVSHHDVDRERREVDRLRRLPGCAGLLLYPLEEGQDFELIRGLVQDRFPLVLIDRFLPELETDAVVSDDYGGGYEAASHLLELGHRHLAFLTGVGEGTSSVAGRLQGFRQAVVDAGLPLRQAHCLLIAQARPSDEDPERAWARTEERIAAWLRQHPEVTGIVAVHDVFAVHAVRVARSLGRRIPEELAVVSFGDYFSGQPRELPLSSIAMDLRGLGREAARLLLARLAQPDQPPVRVELPTRLVVRASSDPRCAALPAVG